MGEARFAHPLDFQTFCKSREARNRRPDARPLAGAAFTTNSAGQATHKCLTTSLTPSGTGTGQSAAIDGGFRSG